MLPFSHIFLVILCVSLSLHTRFVTYLKGNRKVVIKIVHFMYYVSQRNCFVVSI